MHGGTAHGIPYLVGAQANVSCRVEGSNVYGSHRIFIGPVCDVRVRQQVNPLIYPNGLDDGVDWVIPTR